MGLVVIVASSGTLVGVGVAEDADQIGPAVATAIDDVEQWVVDPRPFGLQPVGAELAIPLGVITFLAAFVPFVGAIVAGALATLVALSTADLTAALIVLAVAVAVQQLDNDLFAPVVYGRNVSMHPVWILFAIVGGGALFGVGGTIAAVPIMAVAVNVAAEVVALRAERAAAMPDVPAVSTDPAVSAISAEEDGGRTPVRM